MRFSVDNLKDFWDKMMCFFELHKFSYWHFGKTSHKTCSRSGGCHGHWVRDKHDLGGKWKKIRDVIK